MEDDLRVQVARLEERMKTMQAEYKTDIARLAEAIADGRTEAAQRETNLVLRIAALLAGAVAILGVLIRVL